jgi:serine phosphatase RsbU (regulator of sigma subunit)
MVQVMTRKVLVVDDQPDVLEAMRLLLKGGGYASETALSPEQALAAAAAGDHDLVVIDMNYARDTTSGAEGLALLGMLHARRPEDAGASAFLLGDVAGKGTGAALLMANLQGTIRGNRELAGEPARLITRTNQLFYQSTAPEHYATLFFGVYEAVGRTLRYVNCGHPPAVLLRADGEIERLDPTGLVLGAFEHAVFEERELQIAEGDRLVIFSDGVSEARPDEDDAWAVDCIRMLGRARSTALAESLAMAAAGSTDDVTVLDLRFS